MPWIKPPVQNTRLLSGFPYVCPEPGWANLQFLVYTGAQTTAAFLFFRTALRVLLERILRLLPLHQQRVVDPVMVAVALVCAHYQKTPLFLSAAFPVFVPSLSWQNHHVLL